MVDREHPHASKPGIDEKPRHHTADKGGRTAGSQDALLREREHAKIAINVGQRVGAAHRVNRHDNKHG